MDARSKTEFAAKKRFYNSWPGDLAGILSFGGVNKSQSMENPLAKNARNGAPSSFVMEKLIG